MQAEEIDFEPEMSLTQMVDLLSGKDNKLSEHLSSTFSMQTKFVEVLANLDFEVTKPVKQMNKDKIGEEMLAIKHLATESVQT